VRESRLGAGIEREVQESTVNVGELKGFEVRG